ncbi:hypothetical protein GU243_00445 [Pseudarthrobacter psychrotolerans]|uniref:Uncharacterized protein n=1 Tax=Pseudarthrobacter psychrotolerans TaxID=2697569 RepID=A0A6P1NE22_9MICC|nr:hypothetical protein [Pseudarthrobacter psychrotolerans]QHK18506.1 hypothetical protein GU243_00445 [Pseudarthrobacter psychrotolerans]
MRSDATPRRIVILPHQLLRRCVQRQWSNLTKGQHVELRRHGKAVDAGRIDDVAASADVIWLFSDHQTRRYMIHRSDGLDVWVWSVRAR